MTQPVPRAAVVVPVKSFELAKGRLASILDGRQRAELAREMAAGVIAAAAPLPVWVVCDSHEVSTWALDRGAGVVWRAVPDLNEAVTTGVDFLLGEGFARAIVAHGDLPLARRLDHLDDPTDPHRVTIVPDRRGDGTNVLSVPTGSGFRFAYGSASAAAHRAEAERLGLGVRIVDDPDLAWDVDTPDDLAVFEQRRFEQRFEQRRSAP